MKRDPTRFGTELRGDKMFIYGDHLGDVRIDLDSLGRFITEQAYSSVEEEFDYCTSCGINAEEVEEWWNFEIGDDTIVICGVCKVSLQQTLKEFVEDNITSVSIANI